MHQCSPIFTRTITLISIACLLFALQAYATPSSWLGVWEGTIGNQPVMVCYESGGQSAYFYESLKTEIPLTENVGNWSESVNGIVKGVWTLSNVETSVCVLADDGRVECDGYIENDQQVDGTMTDSRTKLKDAKSIALGWRSACAVLSNGHVKCWGSDFLKFQQISLPHEISNIKDAKSVVVSNNYACVLLAGGTVKCWGKNDYGQLGNGKSKDSDLPVTVKYLSGAVSILPVAGVNTCALLKTGGIKCWGSVSQDATTHGSDANFELITGYKNATALASDVGYDLGGGFLYALERDKTVRCGPINTNEDKIYKVAGLSDVVKLAGGNGRMCALLRSGHVRCWSANHITQSNNLMSIKFDGE